MPYFVRDVVRISRREVSVTVMKEEVEPSITTPAVIESFGSDLSFLRVACSPLCARIGMEFYGIYVTIVEGVKSLVQLET